MIVGDGGLKVSGGYWWVLARDEDVIATGHGSIKGSIEQLSSFRTKAVRMASTVYFINKVAGECDIRIQASLWSDNAALVRRVQMLEEHDPVKAHAKNDHDA